MLKIEVVILKKLQGRKHVNSLAVDKKTASTNKSTNMFDALKFL